MLQPLQLKDVSVRYPREIAELRDFLTKSGCALGSAECLRDIAGRLRQDRGFRRDLTLYVWVVMDGNGQISYPDLLGIVAIAAAGRFAAQADENDAHDLLRFLMDARRSLERAPETASSRPAPAPVLPIAPVAPLAAEPFPVAMPEPVHASPAPGSEEAVPARPQLVRDEVRPAAPTPIRPIAEPTPVAEPIPDVARAAVRDDDAQDVLPVRSQPFRSQYASFEEPEESDDTGKRLAWAVAALCLLVGLGVGAMKYMHRTPEGGSTVVDSGAETGTNAAGGVSGAPANAHRGIVDSRTGSKAPGVSNQGDSGTAVSAARDSRAYADGAPYAPAPGSASSNTAPAASDAAPAGHSTSSPSAKPKATAGHVPTAVTTTRPGSPAAAASKTTPIPATALSKRLDSPTIRGEAGASGSNTVAAPAPRLLRRRPGADDGHLVAEVQPTGKAASTANNATPAAPVRGTVHSTSLGVSAAYVLYSPEPTYPPAASAAHVQGEVRVQADVDRDGNVASAHVISGPPLLRDAALNAIQHWHYKPYMNGGKPSAMTALTVVDFQLP